MLADFQDALGALVTDGALRARYLSAPDEVLGAFALAAADRAALRAIPPAELDRYARSLLAKRSDELCHALPLTSRVAPGLAALYRRWLADHPVTAADEVLGPGVSEALRALPALRQALAADGAVPAWGPDLLAFETCRAASRGDGQPRQGQSAFPLHEIVADLERELLPMEVAASPHAYRFERSIVRWRRP